MVTKQQVLDAFNFRYAAKVFDASKKISDKDFDFLLEIARLSPSSHGLEPWNIIVVQDESLRRKLREHAWGAQSQLDTASHFVIFTAKTKAALAPGSKHTRHILNDIQHIDPEKFAAREDGLIGFLRDQSGALDSGRGVFDWSAKQAYIALANMMTGAALIGIDSCAIEGFDARKIEQLLSNEKLIKSNEDKPAVMAAFGYRSSKPTRPKTRRPLNEIVAWVK